MSEPIGMERFTQDDQTAADQSRPLVHSPGPFSIAGGGYLSLSDANGVEIARVGCWNQRRQPDDEICERNAALFSASPDLLKSCRELIDAMHEYEMCVDGDQTRTHRWMMTNAKQAVKKATSVV